MSRFYAHAMFAREWRIPNFQENKNGKNKDWEEVENLIANED